MRVKIRQTTRSAFARTDLLAVLVVALLCFLPALVLASDSAASDAARCLRNIRQLQIAWLNYAQDNNDILVASLENSPGAALLGRPVVVRGNLDFSSGRHNWDPSVAIEMSP